jgi:hypothetical protein
MPSESNKPLFDSLDPDDQYLVRHVLASVGPNQREDVIAFNHDALLAAQRDLRRAENAVRQARRSCALRAAALEILNAE